MSEDRITREKQRDARTLRQPLIGKTGGPQLAGIATVEHLVRVKREILGKWLGEALPYCNVKVTDVLGGPSIHTIYRIRVDLISKEWLPMISVEHTMTEPFLEMAEAPIDRLAFILASGIAQKLVQEVGL